MLITKYRPTNLDEIWGNEITKTSIRNLLLQKGVSHSYLLTGDAGCGKTTLARVLAKELQCEEILEYNSAFMSKIEDVRNILSNLLPYTSWTGGNVGIILDECHAYLSKAQGPLLKPLEEPPDHIYWFLCTNYEEKLTKALRSRLTTLVMNPLTFKEMFKFLKFICEQENVKVENLDLFDVIFRASYGIPRIALNLLEKVLHVSYEEALNIIGQTNIIVDENNSNFFELYKAIISGNSTNVMQVINDLNINDNDVESLRWYLMNVFNKFILQNKSIKLAKQAVFFLDSFEKSGKLGLTLACLNASMIK